MSVTCIYIALLNLDLDEKKNLLYHYNLGRRGYGTILCDREHIEFFFIINFSVNV